MSQLQKAIGRIQRREGPRMGFGPATREQPRAMLAGCLVSGAEAFPAMASGGADLIVLQLTGPATKAPAIGARSGPIAGALVSGLEAAAADGLKAAGYDFFVSPLEATAAAAIDQEKLGTVISVPAGITDTSLRSIASLGLDALHVPAPPSLSLAAQLELVRLAGFASTPLLLTVRGVPEVAELRVLRDSGVAGILLPAGSSRADMEALVANLKAVPPRRPRREGSEVAMVPSQAGTQGGDGEDEDDD